MRKELKLNHTIIPPPPAQCVSLTMEKKFWFAHESDHGPSLLPKLPPFPRKNAGFHICFEKKVWCKKEPNIVTDRVTLWLWITLSARSVRSLTSHPVEWHLSSYVLLHYRAFFNTLKQIYTYGYHWNYYLVFSSVTEAVVERGGGRRFWNVWRGIIIF